MDGININPKINYERIDNGDVFTGQQLLNLLEIATLSQQLAILLIVVETDKPATKTGKYGV